MDNNGSAEKQRGKSIVKRDIHIEKAVEADIDCIERLYEDVCDYLEMHKNYPGWKKGIYPVRQDAEKGVMKNALYVARVEEKIAGTIILKHDPEEGYKNGSWLTKDDYRYIYVIYTLAVHPDFQKCGVATELLMFAEQVARKEGGVCKYPAGCCKREYPCGAALSKMRISADRNRKSGIEVWTSLVSAL